MKTQNERLLSRLEEGHPINQMIALNELGIFRLASRISELKKQGYRISSKLVEVSNR